MTTTMPIGGIAFVEAPERRSWRDEGVCEGCTFEDAPDACMKAIGESRKVFGGTCAGRGVIYAPAPSGAAAPEPELAIPRPAPARPNEPTPLVQARAQAVSSLAWLFAPLAQRLGALFPKNK